MAFGQQTSNIAPVEKEKVQGQPSKASMALAFKPKGKKKFAPPAPAKKGY